MKVHSFERSPAGQINRNLFLGTDVILYTEGGNQESSSDESFDVLFWSTVLRKTRPELRVRIIPKGGKAQVFAAIQPFIGTTLNGVYAALDADYDALKGETVADTHVIYTYGYSFENDAMVRDALLRTFYVVCPRCPSDLDIAPALDEALTAFVKKTYKLVLADYLASIQGISVIDRERPQKYISPRSHGSKPNIRLDLALCDIANARAVREGKFRHLPNCLKIEMPRDTVGHLYSDFCYRLMAYFQSLHSKKAKFSVDAFFSFVIQSFGELFTDMPANQVIAHYRAQTVHIRA